MRKDRSSRSGSAGTRWVIFCLRVTAIDILWLTARRVKYDSATARKGSYHLWPQTMYGYVDIKPVVVPPEISPPVVLASCGPAFFTSILWSTSSRRSGDKI